MMGSGFIRQMIDSSRQNRSLLKGEGTYTNFDKSYITDYLVKSNKRRITINKVADPEYLRQLQSRMIQDNLLRKRWRLFLLLALIMMIGTAMWMFIS